MKKKNVEDLQDTVVHRLSAAKNNEELKKVQSDLLEWIRWLKKDSKISSSDYAALHKVIDTQVTVANKSLERGSTTKSSFLTKKTIGMILLLLSVLSLFVFVILYVQITSFSREDGEVVTTIPFRGTLRNAEGEPIDSKTDVVFRLYDRENADIPLYEGQCVGTNGIIPDYRGEFTVVLGSDCGMSPVQQSVLENEVIFLGVTISNGNEIVPRYRILNSAYSYNSAQLSGKSVGTDSNNIPFLDNNGILLLEATNPMIKSTNGLFTIEGASLSLKTIDGGEGDIILQPGVGGNTIIPAGHIGLGTFEPDSKLEVVGVEPFKPISVIKNISIEDSENTEVLSLGLGTTKNGVNAKFVTFLANVTKEEIGTEMGSIRLNNGGVSYETQGADFAEYFQSEKQYSVGTVISLSNKGVVQAHVNEKIIGVVSDTAGFIGNSKLRSENSILVALVGQVYIRVTNEKGTLAVGDPIAIGSVPGFGVKGESINRVGYVLEEMSTSMMKEADCPQEFRHIKDLSGSPIRCGYARILLRQN